MNGGGAIVAVVSVLRCDPRTQKARGVRALVMACWRTPAAYWADSLEDAKEAYYFLHHRGYEVFVRPCPVRPRHGFVESRVVRSVNALVRAWEEAKAADPQAELLVMEYVPADYNVVVGPTTATAGTGHEGATAGLGPQVTLPWSGCPRRLQPLLDEAGITGSPYFEFVVRKDQMGDPWATQLRDGPYVPASQDYVPRRQEVLHVVEATGTEDLLEWERRVRAFPPGTVVYMPNGSLTCHAAVHCVTAGVPVLTSRRPRVGEVLEPTQESEGPDYHAVVRGVKWGMGVPLSEPGWVASAARVVLHAVHQAATMNGAHGFWLGAAAAFAVRIGAALALGELRHGGEQCKIALWDITPAAMSRDAIYEAALKGFQAYLRARRLLPFAVLKFEDRHVWSSDYGGPAWARCTRAVIALDKTLRAVVRGRKASVKTLVQRLNRLVRLAHNNGWWWNKVLPPAAFDRAAEADPRFVASAAASALMLMQLGAEDVDLRAYLNEPEAHRYVPHVERFQASVRGWALHVQVILQDGNYQTFDVALSKPKDVEEALSGLPTAPSAAGSGQPYAVLDARRDGDGEWVCRLGRKTLYIRYEAGWIPTITEVEL